LDFGAPDNIITIYGVTEMTTATSDAKTLIDRVSTYVSPDMAGLVEQAYQFADECHRGQKRVSGEPYIAHPLQTALFLVDLRLDVNTIVAALLHDVVEDCDVALDELASRFGTEVAKLVDGVTKLTKLDVRLQQSDGGQNLFEEQDHLYAESLRKMLVAMAEDIRVVLIKLADRLHNMRTLDVLPPEKRRRIAQETLDIYSPLAHRLGIWEIKWQLDDLAFFYLDEDRYHEISNMLAAKREEREAYVGQVASRLREAMKVSNLTGEVVGRPKSIYSTYRKMERYAAQGKELSDIYDLYALRVLVDSQDDCYKTLGVIHQLWHPIPGQFDDYIANPKENMYQALHTTVICDGGSPLEVQIKTYELHEIAEYGVAAHWRYKEGRANDLRFEEKMTWLRQVLDWQREMAATDEFIESVKQDIFQDQVFVYTPKGEIVELTAGSTPIDFGYKIHTDLGHRCIGAKVNGRLVSLDTKLQNGDTVEVLASKLDRGPSLDWLNPNRGYVGSASARQKVRLWFRRQARSANIQRGRELLRRELRRLNQRLDDAEVLSLCNYDNMEELLANLGSGGITESQVGYRLAQARQEPLSPIVGGKPKLALSSPGSGISVLGVGDLLTRMAPCCNPIPGDSITGFVTRARGVTVHKQGCSNLANEDEPERIVNVDWGTTYELYPVRIRVTAYDRVGLLRDVTSAVSAEDVNIASVVTKEHPDGTVTMELTIYTKNLEQLGRLFAKLEGVRSIIEVTRDRSTIPLLTPN
jgi:GTP pyrophosphokinase